MEVRQIGNCMVTGKRENPNQGRVYDSSGLCPTITNMQGGGRQPMIIDAQAIRMVRTEEGKKLRKQYESHEIEHGFNEHREMELRTDGVSNTLSTVQKDNYICEKVRIKQATKEGYIECKVGGVADLSFPSSATRRGRVQEGGDVCPTLTATESEICRIEKEEVANEESISEILRVLRKEIGEEAFSEWAIRGLCCVLQEEVLRQNVYAKSVYESWTYNAELFKCTYHSEGNQQSVYSEESVRDMWENWTVGCSPQRRGLSEQQRGQFDDFMQKLPHEAAQQKTFVYYLWKSSEGIGILRQALSEIQKIWESDDGGEVQRYRYRIRKLTPKSCWRLMDFSDDDFHKAEAVNSNTRLYAQAGNSIVRNVLVAIFGQMLPGKEDEYKKGA